MEKFLIIVFLLSAISVMELYQKPDRYGFNGSFNSVVAYLIMITLGVIIIAVSLIAFVYVYVHNIK